MLRKIDSYKVSNQECGSALVYILIAIALLAALTVTFMEPSSQQTSSQGSFRASTAIKSQVSVIRSAIQECRIAYKKGDRSIDITSSGSDPDAQRNYPIKPNSSHYSAATIGPTADRFVKDVRCPGDPGNNNVNHLAIFSGSSGKFLPPAPDLFSEWKYYNGIDGVFVWLETDKTDAFLQSALDKLDDVDFAECEADVIAASGSAVSLDSTSEVSCPSNSLCFRVRITTKPSAVYNGDANNDEASCP